MSRLVILRVGGSGCITVWIPDTWHVQRSSVAGIVVVEDGSADARASLHVLRVERGEVVPLDADALGLTLLACSGASGHTEWRQSIEYGAAGYRMRSDQALSNFDGFRVLTTLTAPSDCRADIADVAESMLIPTVDALGSDDPDWNTNTHTEGL